MNPPDSTDRASLLTPAGRGAVAVVAAEGPAAAAEIGAHFRAANGRHLRTQAAGGVVFGHWLDGNHAEEVILCPLGDLRFEVHCHGGAAAATRILDGLSAGGVQIESWRDWQRRRAPDALHGEASVALASAATRRVAAILLDQQAGALRRVADAAVDDVAAGRLEPARARIEDVLQWAAFGQRLVQPWHVALAGEPNVGKSSLMNAIVGYQRAIVYNQPGTTRDVLDATTAIDGWPVRLTDAAGLRHTDDSLEAAGVSLARQQLADADLVLWILDATQLDAGALSTSGRTFREAFILAGGSASASMLAVVNKIDLVDAARGHASGSAEAARDDAVFVSALTGAGLDALLAAISRRLVPQAPPPGQAAPINARQHSLLARAAEALSRRSTPEAVAALRHLTAPGAAAPGDE